MFVNKKGRHWTAKWIWHSGTCCEKNTYFYFRKEFSVEKDFRKAELHISASNKYRVYVNGCYIGNGPAQSQPYYPYYDTYNVGIFLHQGLNVIAAEVNYTGLLEDTRGGFLVECTADENTIICTGEEWKCRKALPWNESTPRTGLNIFIGYNEYYDSRLEAFGWKEVGFDDNRWEYAAVLPGRHENKATGVYPWIVLFPRDIPLLPEKRLYPAAIERIEECLESAGTAVIDNVSDLMSMDIGKPLKFCRVENAKNLLKKEEGSTLVQNSILHIEDYWYDGVYDPCIVLDFGRIVTAYVELELDGVNGGIVEIGYAERLVEGRLISSVLETKYADRYIMKDGLQKFRTFYWKAFRYLKLKFRNCYTPVSLLGIHAMFCTFPFKYRGSFQCNDDFYNRLWEISRYTIQLCCNDSIMDSPWREQHQWLGDVSAVTLGGMYAAFGDMVLSSKFLKQTGNSTVPFGLAFNQSNLVSHDWKNTIPDYNMWWIQAVWNHYMYTGDEVWIHSLYPHVCRNVQFFDTIADEDGLITTSPLWTFVDWADIDRRGACAPVNAIYYGSLEYVEKMASFKQDIYMYDYCVKTRERLKISFNQRFWKDNPGIYVDAYVDRQQSEKKSEHTNILAILYGLADIDRTAALIRMLYENKELLYTEAAPFFSFFVIQALEAAGRIDLSMKLIKERWGRMLSHGATSTWEEWGINGSRRYGNNYAARWRSLSHAWSAGPLEFLSKKLVGLEILEPGCRKIKLSPVSGGLLNYTVIFPTPLGDVKIEYDGQRYDVNAPDAVQVILGEG